MEDILNIILNIFNLSRVQVCTIEKDKYTGFMKISSAEKVADTFTSDYDKINHTPNITCTTYRYQEVLLEIFLKGHYFYNSEFLNLVPASSQQFLESLTRKANIESINAYKVDAYHFLTLHYCNKNKSRQIPRDEIEIYINQIKKYL
jgi:hypothetical protein